jgi:phospholipid/cholesterol/gamma-HCH transport system substrate-binding protein
MIRTANNKGYFELRLRPFDDYFYLFQLVSDERGYIQRSETIRDRFDYNNTLLIAPEIADQYRFPPKIEKTKRIKNTILFSVQFGKTFDRLAFRIGVFENTFGFGVDFIVPVPTNKFHWITTVELFDGIGINRFNDRRPHLKWLNKLFFLKNFYTAFGVDDIVSKKNANAFIGGGMRFNDNDLKYVLSALPISIFAAQRY